MVRAASDDARFGISPKKSGLAGQKGGLFWAFSADCFDRDRLNAIIGGLVTDNPVF